MIFHIRSVIYTTAFIVVISHINCQISNELDVDGIQKQIGQIPGLDNYNASDLPNEEDLERLLKEKCVKNGGGEETVNALKNQQAQVQACIEAQLNFTQIQEEVEEAKKTGSMDEVFGKYCKKYPEIRQCFEESFNTIRPCLDSAEQSNLNKTLDIADELKEFICYKDGDRIAMFIAERGVECLESKKDELQACANKTLGRKIPTDMSINSLPSFIFTNEECNDFEKIRTCVGDELEKCEDSTPANIVDAFFKFLKKHLPCENTEAQKKGALKTTSGSERIYATALIVTVIVSRFL